MKLNLNISGQKENNLYLAFTNQSDKDINATIKLNNDLVTLTRGNAYIHKWIENKLFGDENLKSCEFQIQVKANGISAVRISGVKCNVKFQKDLSYSEKCYAHNYEEFEFGNARAMLFDLGDYGQRLYVYLRKDDSEFKEVKINYTEDLGKKKILTDTIYPFEFTLPLDPEQKSIQFFLSGTTQDNKMVNSKSITLGSF